jgi:hypothetical protein
MQVPKYKISFFDNCYSNTANEKELSFDEILDYFRKAARRKFVVKEQLEAMIGGTLTEGKRTTESLTCRSIITYDIDYYKHNLDMLLDYVKECLKDNTYICYTTASSTFDKPRVRILVFVNKTMSAQEYRIVSLNVAKTLFKEFFNSDIGKIDEASYSPCYLMYLPIFREGFKTLKNAGELLDITEYLSLEIKEETTEIQEFLKTVKNTPLSISDDRVREVLAEYNVEDTDRDSWLKVCQGLHHQYKGSDEGYKLFLEWSLTDTRFSKDKIRVDTKTAYYSLKSNRSNPITFASTISVVNDKKKLPIKLNVENKEPPNQIGYNYFVHTKENKKGEITGIKSTYENFKIMCEHYGVKIQYDIITKRNLNSFGNNDDNLVSGRMSSLMELNDMKVGFVDKYVNMLAHDNSTNSFKVLMDGISWDGKSRFKEFCETIEVEEEFKEARDLYLLKWMQQMLYLGTYSGYRKIARQILVFQSGQKCGKSTWMKALFPENLTGYVGVGLTLNTNDPMSIMTSIKHLVVELAEVDMSLTKSGVDGFKACFGRCEDILNVKYLPYPVTYMRTTSFIGTVNNGVFLRDKTGSTRFLVLPIKKVNGFHNIDMLQLYREILDTTDYINFELNDEDSEKQRLLNEQFERPDLIDEQFTNMFETAFESKVEDESVGSKYMNCTDILEQIGYSKRDINYNRRLDLEAVLDKYKFKYRKDLKKWLVKIKQGDN